jgi:hypothetical protein
MCSDWMARVVELFLQLSTIKLLGFSDPFKLLSFLMFSLFSVLCSLVVGRSDIVGWDEYFVFVVVRKLNILFLFC